MKTELPISNSLTATENVMKNLFKTMMLVAAAAMGFTACSKDAVEDFDGSPAEATKTITVRADIESTRISLNDGHTKFVWSAGDQLGAFTATGTKSYQSAAYAEGSTSFGITVDQTAVAGTEVYAYYPYYSNNKDKTSVSLYVASDQNQAEAGKLCGINSKRDGQYPLVATGTIDDKDEVSLTFRPVACAFALNIYGPHAAGEKIESVSFTPNGTIHCNGSHHVDLTALPADFKYTAKDGNHGTNTVTLGTPFEPDTDKPAADAKNSYGKQVYICVAKADYSNGGTFVVKTSETTYTFTTNNPLDCSNCDLYAMNLNLEKGEKPAPVVTRTYTKVTAEPADWSGKYIIAYEGHVVTGLIHNNHLTKETVTAFDENTITCSSNYEITIEKSATDGYYTLKNSEGKYIGWTSSTNATAEDQASTDHFLWALKVITAQTQQAITTLADNKRNIRYNGSSDYRVYSGTTNSAPSFYTISGPAVSISEKTISLKADDLAAHTFPYSVSGDGATLANVTMTQDSGTDWLKAESDNNGTVTYTALSANTADAPRTATLTLSIPDGNSVTVTISQAAPAKKLAVSLTTDGTAVSWSTTPSGPVAGYNYTVTADADGTGEALNSATGTTETSVDLSKLGLETGTYYVHVQALGDNIATLDSDIAHSTGIDVVKSNTAPAGTELWAETFGTNGDKNTTFSQISTLISNYNYSGRTGYNDNANSVTYTSDSDNNVRIAGSTGTNMTESHLWFWKSKAGVFTTGAINLYGAEKLIFSYSTSKGKTTVSYSIDGGSSWKELGTNSTANTAKAYTFTVASGTQEILIRIAHPSSDATNTRVDNLKLEIAE